MTNERHAKTGPSDHVNELLSFIDNSLDAYTKEKTPAKGSDIDQANRKDTGLEENLIALKKKVLRLKKAFEAEAIAKESEIKILREAFRQLSSKMSKFFLLSFSWLLFLTFLLLRD